MVNRRLGIGLLTVVVVGLVAGLVGGVLGAIVVLRFANMQIVQTALIRSTILASPRFTPSPTMHQMSLSPTVTPPSLPTATPVPDIDQTTIEVVQANQSSVVTVVSLQGESAEQGPGEAKAVGSGIVLDHDGHIVTNEHVIRDAADLRVILPNGEEVIGTLVGLDRLTDLAVVKIDSNQLVPAVFGDSSSLQPGQRVVAIGSALGGFRNTVTVGVVSALGRQVVPRGEEYALENLIQTDVAINHGNSGGPLLDMQGEVVGVNTILIRRERDSEEVVQGISFAVPSNTVQQIVPQLVADGQVARPYLGVETQMVTSEVKATYALTVDHGARVETVLAGSPAERAGLRHGDVILAIDGEAINEDKPFINVLMRYHIDDTVELLVDRVGEELTLIVTLAESPEPYSP